MSKYLQSPEERLASSKETMRKVRRFFLYLLPFNTFMLGLSVQAWHDETGSLRFVVSSLGSVLLSLCFVTKNERLKWLLLFITFASLAAAIILPR